VVPAAEPRSYYGRRVVKQPVWTWEVPTYFFTGGLAGVSASLAYGAERQGNGELARAAWLASLGGVAVSPALLVSDLGRPGRFLNMLRVFKVTSPMSVGSWVLTAASGAIGVAAANATLGLFPRAARAAKPAAAVLGLPLATYTALLVSNTAIPVWHEARRVLPLLFAASSATSAGAAAATLAPPGHAAPARRLAVGGALASGAAMKAMESGLGELAEPYRHGRTGALARAGKALLAGGAALMAAAGRDRRGARAAGAVLLAGVMCERWAIYRAGFDSARDPKYTVGPQRARAGASR
jgi:hypothetical protein